MAMLRTALQAPPAEAPRVGLLASARVREGEDDRWEVGGAYAPEGCNAGGVADPCQSAAKNLLANPASVEFDPFVVWAGDKCSAFGFGVRDAEARARRQLLATQSFQIEREFWRGDLARARGWNNRYLAHPVSDALTVAAATPIDALACLELGLGEIARGARGMIHAPRNVVTLWDQAGMLRREGALLLTASDTIVVPGAGYDGSGPGANPGDAPVARAAGSIWAYGTTMVSIRLSPVEVFSADAAETTNRSVNTIEVRAERLAAVTFDGCAHVAVQINAPLCDVGGAA